MVVHLKINDDVEIEVFGSYDSGEPATYYPVDSSNPGYPPIFEIDEIKLIKGTLLDFLLAYSNKSWSLLQNIEQDCINNINR
jgi:hypothetical protein